MGSKIRFVKVLVKLYERGKSCTKNGRQMQLPAHLMVVKGKDFVLPDGNPLTTLRIRTIK